MGLNDTIQAIMPDGYMVTKVAMATEVFDSATGERRLVMSHSETTTMWDAVGMLDLISHDIKTLYASLGNRPIGQEDEEDG